MSAERIHSPEQFAEVLANNDDVVVDFSAPAWCAPCRALMPHFESASDKLSNIKFAIVDIDELPELSNNYGIMSVPTVLRFRDGDRENVAARNVINLVKELGE